MKANSVTEEYKLLLSRVGENISKARNERGLTQRELGRIAEKNQTVIAKIEKFPPLDMTMRSIYEIVRHIPVPLSEVIAKAERDLELFSASKIPQKIEDRMAMVMEKLQELTPDEQLWISGIIEGLLDRTSSPLKLTDNTDNRWQLAVPQPS